MSGVTRIFDRTNQLYKASNPGATDISNAASVVLPYMFQAILEEINASIQTRKNAPFKFSGVLKQGVSAPVDITLDGTVTVNIALEEIP